MENHHIKDFTTYRLIKSEDLNHHGTLFAGRGAEWFVEAGFIAASSLLHPKNLICVKIHGMTFEQPGRSGETICYISKAVLAGKTSIVVYVHVTKAGSKKFMVDGFITFVHVDQNTRPTAHNICIVATREEDILLQEQARKLRKGN